MRTVAALISLSLFAPLAVAAPAAAPPASRNAPVGAGKTRTPTAPVAPAAAKSPAVNLTPINLTETPERCHAIAKRASATNLAQALTARISLASCVADAKFSELQLIDGSDSVTALDEAVAPSIAMLDEVVVAAPADPVTQIMATHAKAALYIGMMNRMIQTVTTTDTSPDAQALRETRRTIVQGLCDPWRAKNRDIYAAVDEIAKANPTVIRHPIALAAIKDSREQLARHVAIAPEAPAGNELEVPDDKPEPDAKAAAGAKAAP